MAKPRKTKEEKRVEKFIADTAQRLIGGYQINMMDIPKMFKAGEDAAAAGKSDAEIEASLTEARDRLATKTN